MADSDRIFGLELVTRRGQEYTPLNFADVYEVVENLMRLYPEELDTIQMHGPNPKRIDLTTASSYVWERKDIFGFLEK